MARRDDAPCTDEQTYRRHFEVGQSADSMFPRWRRTGRPIGHTKGRCLRANEEIGQHLRLAAAAPPVLQEGLAGEEESRFREPLPGAFSAPRRSFLQDFVLGLPDRAVTGGAAYDALVAATAAASGAEVFTCDRRAAAIYDRYGVRNRFLA